MRQLFKCAFEQQFSNSSLIRSFIIFGGSYLIGVFKMFGYMGKILKVNLSTAKITEEIPDEQTLNMFLGGSWLATKYLFDKVKRGVMRAEAKSQYC